jgi:DNA-binding MarR family transcriptional regulator
MPTAATESVTAILHELSAIARTSRHLLGDAPLPGLTPATAAMLGLLVRRGDRRCGDIADELGVDASSVSRKLAELERLGLVRRRPDPADGRAWLNSPTPAGRTALELLRDRYLAAVASSLETWTDGELAGLAAALRRLHADLTTGPTTRHHTRHRTTHHTTGVTDSAIDITGQEAYA